MAPMTRALRIDEETGSADHEDVRLGDEDVVGSAQRPRLQDVVGVEPAEQLAGRSIETRSEGRRLAAVRLEHELAAELGVALEPLARPIRGATVEDDVLHLEVRAVPLARHRRHRLGQPGHPVQNGADDGELHWRFRLRCGSRLAA